MDKLCPIILHKRWPNASFGENEYVCQLTKEIDKYLKGTTDVYYSYFYSIGQRKLSNGIEGFCYIIRSPGSTKGCIFIDKYNKIIYVDFYEDTLSYFNPEVKTLEKLFRIYYKGRINMKVRPKEYAVLYMEGCIFISLKPQQRWECKFHEDYINVERDNVTLKLSEKEFKKYFK